MRPTARRARQFLLEHLEEKVSLDALAEHARTDKLHRCRGFSRELGGSRRTRSSRRLASYARRSCCAGEWPRRSSPRASASAIRARCTATSCCRRCSTCSERMSTMLREDVEHGQGGCRTWSGWVSNTRKPGVRHMKGGCLTLGTRVSDIRGEGFGERPRRMRGRDGFEARGAPRCGAAFRASWVGDLQRGSRAARRRGSWQLGRFLVRWRRCGRRRRCRQSGSGRR